MAGGAKPRPCNEAVTRTRPSWGAYGGASRHLQRSRDPHPPLVGGVRGSLAPWARAQRSPPFRGAKLRNSALGQTTNVGDLH